MSPQCRLNVVHLVYMKLLLSLIVSTWLRIMLLFINLKKMKKRCIEKALMKYTEFSLSRAKRHLCFCHMLNF